MKESFFQKYALTAAFLMKIKTTRKPGTGMLTEYMNSEEYDLKNSFVIGDRITDVKLADNLGCRAMWLNNHDAFRFGGSGCFSKRTCRGNCC